MTDEQELNVAGKTTALTAISEIKPWGRPWLAIFFNLASKYPSLTSTVRDLQFIHFAFWTVIKKLPQNGAPQQDRPLRRSILLFQSNFNGSWREYIITFSKKLTRGMRVIWASSFGFPGPLPVEPFMDYIYAHEQGLEADVYFAAYEATTAEVERALELDGVTHGPLQVTSFLAIAPIMPSRTSGLAEGIRRSGDGLFNGLERTHFARIVIAEKLDGDLDYVIFAAHFDGHLDTYLEEMNKVTEFWGIFGMCVGWEVGKTLRDYLLHNQVDIDFSYAPYGYATVEDVKKALENYPPSEHEWMSDTPGVRLRAERAARLAVAHAEPGKRCQHAEGYGREATLTVDYNCPDWARVVGLADDGPQEAVVRFSKNMAMRRPALGMGVKSPKQDWIMATGERFFLKDDEEAEEFLRCAAEGKMRRFFLGGPPWRWRLKALRLQWIARGMWPGAKIDRFFSQTAFMHGDVPVKWSTVPAGSSAQDEYILRVQRRLEGESVDDPRELWQGPWERCATIKLGEVVDVEGIVMSLDGVLGPVGEVRCAAYGASAKQRQEASARSRS